MKSFNRQIADWASQKAPDETYDYGDTEGCALCSFLKENGFTNKPSVGGDYWVDDESQDRKMHNFDEILAEALVSTPHTFGALASRLSA